MRILIVEDEKKVAGFIKKGLEEELYAVDVASEGEEGLAMAEDSPYDLIILDIMLPKLDGLEILSHLRSKKINVPIINCRNSSKLMFLKLDNNFPELC